MSGSVLELPTDHPGVSDPVYITRRNHIADLSTDLELGARPPHVEYTQVENDVWSTVNSALTSLHTDYAVAEYRSAAARLDLPTK